MTLFSLLKLTQNLHDCSNPDPLAQSPPSARAMPSALCPLLMARCPVSWLWAAAKVLPLQKRILGVCT